MKVFLNKKIFLLITLVFLSTSVSVYAQEASTTPDITSPSISDVTISSVLPLGINIVWLTDEPAIYTFEYGTSTSYGLNISTSTNLSASGTAVLTNLLSDITYYYCIHATDASSNTSNSCDSFTTAPAPDTTSSIISGIVNEFLLSSSTKIVWITDELAYSKLRYGKTSHLGSETTLETTASLLHETILTELTPNTKYYYCIDATDITGNKSHSCGHTFTTATQTVFQDTVPPVVTLLSVISITSSSSKITWTTNEDAKTQVQYGLTLDYGITSRLSRNYSLNHSVNLYGLTPTTLYHYRIRSVDRTGNVYLSPDETFTTAALPQPNVPNVIPPPNVPDVIPPPPAPSYVDGASESGAVRVETIMHYRDQSGLTQKINALSSTANFSVFLPVLFGVRINNTSSSFGDPRSGGRLHEGEDIMAVKGTPIVSPTAAVVLRTGVGPTEGNYVYTANPGRETFVYMHLDRIGEGVVSGAILETGSLIGYVGNTGNASGGAAHLHFEIHNSSGVPVDPFPRTTGEFTIEQKISFLNKILTQTSDATTLAQFLVSNFRSTFTEAITRGIALPSIITGFLASMPNISAPTASSGGLPAGDLKLGSSGTLVVALQKYLIQAASGAAASRLAGAGATGYFGTITKAALVEFQAANGISATGYYGPITRAFIAAHSLPTSQTTATNNSTASSTVAFTRNLHLGMSGEDVRMLQKLLNAKGFVVASTGSGSPGNETTYFGSLTKAAVIRFQIAREISPIAGYVGPLTRVAFASL